ncbi:uncharacterized protein LOC111456628 isoform X2 [Cucurbita moschata]|uniref:Uncharacterized protein LOC111456628 isoform X2 n=1 Tax=Cucurbita moschata TaxID=3662 RepID=A0A6J1GQX3_CUCMO|nr:uncharacterized protein LOC111456628 isoform X2 [Cucurbita moschata]
MGFLLCWKAFLYWNSAMDGGQIDDREKDVVEDGPEAACDGAVVDCSDDEPQVVDEIPVRVRQSYFDEVLSVESPNINAMIKKAEETIERINEDQVLLAQKIRKRVMDSDEVRAKLSAINYYDNYGLTPDWERDRLAVLHLSLDKLSFANNAYKDKSNKSCLSGGEVDKQKLCFLMGHDCKNMADERKLLREMNAIQGKDGGMTVEELQAPIECLKEQMRNNYWDCEKSRDDVGRDKAILKDVQQHKIGREKGIGDGVVNGKLWKSLGSQESIRVELQALSKDWDEAAENQIKVNAKMKKLKKKVEKVEKDISCLQKRLKDGDRKKDAAYNTILKLKKQQEGHSVTSKSKLQVI